MLSTIVAFIILYFDRWFLQIIGGSAQQGYFSLSDKLGAIAIIFTSAMTPLLSREFAHSYEEHDKARMARLFDRIKVFLFIASVLGCFMSVQSSAIVELIGGEKYQNAVVPIAIMALYPIHQTFGQLSAALLLATGQTGLYAKIAVLVMLLSVPMSYFFMAPSNYLLPGLALGATGLAIKMLLLQFVGTNIQLYFNTRFLGVSFRKWMIHQLKTVGIIYALALLSRFVAAKIANDYFSAWNVFNIDSHAFTASLHLGFSGIFFIVIVFSVFITAPSLAGIKRDELVTFYCDCFNKLQIKKGL
jgi:O-antigen/teichoic acid export membrane protein